MGVGQTISIACFNAPSVVKNLIVGLQGKGFHSDRAFVNMNSIKFRLIGDYIFGYDLNLELKNKVAQEKSGNAPKNSFIF
jgi:hypothetical protein